MLQCPSPSIFRTSTSFVPIYPSHHTFRLSWTLVAFWILHPKTHMPFLCQVGSDTAGKKRNCPCSMHSIHRSRQLIQKMSSQTGTRRFIPGAGHQPRSLSTWECCGTDPNKQPLAIPQPATPFGRSGAQNSELSPLPAREGGASRAR